MALFLDAKRGGVLAGGDPGDENLGVRLDAGLAEGARGAANVVFQDLSGADCVEGVEGEAGGRGEAGEEV
jgi:hypothetical protein